MAAFLYFSPREKDWSEGAGCGKYFFRNLLDLCPQDDRRVHPAGAARRQERRNGADHDHHHDRARQSCRIPLDTVWN